MQGASAAVNAIILLNVFLFPKNIYYINFIIPVPAVLMVSLCSLIFKKMLCYMSITYHLLCHYREHS